MEKRYTVKEVSERSGVSVRALHLWDEMGLLVPERLENGYRSYTSADLDRLGRILLLRGCGMELKAIASLLDADDAELRSALKRQLLLLHEKEQELAALIDTVEAAIEGCGERKDMSDAEKFEEMKRQAVALNDERYGEEVRERYGEKAQQEANARVLAMDEGTWNHLKDLEGRIIQQLELAMAEGSADGPQAHELVRLHAAWLAGQWGKDSIEASVHLGLAAMYEADRRFLAYYDERAGEGAGEFLVAAIRAAYPEEA